jgi:hypothetical protein
MANINIQKLAEAIVSKIRSEQDDDLSDEELRQLAQAILNLQKNPSSAPWSVEEEINYVRKRTGENDVVIVYDVRVLSGKNASEVAKNNGSIMLKNLMLPNMIVNSVSSFREQCSSGIIQPLHSEFQAYLETKLERKSLPPERGLLLTEKTPTEEKPDFIPGDLE